MILHCSRLSQWLGQPGTPGGGGGGGQDKCGAGFCGTYDGGREGGGYRIWVGCVVGVGFCGIFDGRGGGGYLHLGVGYIVGYDRCHRLGTSHANSEVGMPRRSTRTVSGVNAAGRRTNATTDGVVVLPRVGTIQL